MEEIKKLLRNAVQISDTLTEKYNEAWNKELYEKYAQLSAKITKIINELEKPT